MDMSSIGAAAGGLLGLPATSPTSAGGGGEIFSNLFRGVLSAASSQHAKADQGVLDLSMGRTDQMHQVLLDVANADLTFRMILEVRNKILEAYQEIQKMQI